MFNYRSSNKVFDQLIAFLSINYEEEVFHNFISSMLVKNEEIDGNKIGTVFSVHIINKLFSNDQSKWLT